MKTVSDLTNEARAAARRLTYNDFTQGAAKHLLLEMAHRLDADDFRLHKKRDGILLINSLGKARFATLRERIAMWLMRGTKIRV